MKRTLPLLLTVLLLASCATTSNYSCLSSGTPKNMVNVALHALCLTNGIDASEVNFCVVDTMEHIAEIHRNSVIYISSGFIFSFREELNCALAHELSHYKLGHIAKRDAVSGGVAVAFTVANVFIPGIALASHVVNPTVSSAFSRSCELDADVEAVKMCKSMGIADAVEQYTQMLEKFSAVSDDKSGFSAIWASHPPVADRIANIRKHYPE